MRLQGKNAVITGGANGIGHAIALAYAKEGARVTVLDRDAKGQKTAEAIQKLGGEAAFVQVDVADREKLTAAIQNAGPVDILVTSAAILEKCSILDSTMEDFDRTMETNIHGVMNAVQAVIPGMKAQNSGKIIILSSMASFLGRATRPLTPLPQAPSPASPATPPCAWVSLASMSIPSHRGSSTPTSPSP